MGTAEAEAVEEFTPFVHHLAQPFAGFGVPFEDLMQEGLLAFVLAYRAWQTSPSETVQFKTRAGFAVRDAIRALIGTRREPGTKAAPGPRRLHAREQHVSLDDSGLYNLVGTCPDQEEAIDQGRVVARLGRAVRELPSRDRLVIEMRYGAEHTLQVVADTLGVTAANVHRIEKRVLSSLAKSVAA